MAHNLRDENLRRVIARLGGGALGIRFLIEVGEFVLRLVRLLLRIRGRAIAHRAAYSSRAVDRFLGEPSTNHTSMTGSSKNTLFTGGSNCN